MEDFYGEHDIGEVFQRILVKCSREYREVIIKKNLGENQVAKKDECQS